MSGNERLCEEYSRGTQPGMNVSVKNIPGVDVREWTCLPLFGRRPWRVQLLYEKFGFLVLRRWVVSVLFVPVEVYVLRVGVTTPAAHKTPQCSETTRRARLLLGFFVLVWKKEKKKLLLRKQQQQTNATSQKTHAKKKSPDSTAGFPRPSDYRSYGSATVGSSPQRQGGGVKGLQACP